jgi:hypothetical protein
MRSPQFALNWKLFDEQGEPYSPFGWGCVKQITFEGSAAGFPVRLHPVLRERA